MCPRPPVSHGPPEEAVASMNSAAPASGKPSTRSSSSGYRQKALAEIRNSLLPFANIGGCDSSAASCVSSISSASGSATSGIGSVSGLSSLSNNCVDKELNALRQTLSQLIAMGYTEVRIICITYLILKIFYLKYKLRLFIHNINYNYLCCMMY